ncbi:MAG: sensor diguanylate cyclase [Hyphomicrobiales bacterium]|nr:sensor diguanylate cyclase [Hyphomicrobiales bacterium]
MTTNKLSELSGEYVDERMEDSFRVERFAETVRQGRLLLVVSAILNVLFFASDWRFYGETHFFVAIPARAVVVAVSLVCLFAFRRCASPSQAQRVIVAWEVVTALAVGFLVSSHSDVAIFAVIVLPAIYYLAVPTPFRSKLMSGIGCSIVLLTGFMLPQTPGATTPGLILAMVTMNVALALVVAQGNRLRRLEWSATLSERRANAELAESRKMLEHIFMAVPIPLVVTQRESGKLIQANHAAICYFGGMPTFGEPHTADSIYIDAAERAAFLALLDKDGRVDSLEVGIRLASGERRDVLLAGSTVDLDGTPCIITGAVDISARKAMEARLENLATKDPLTQVANRTQFFAIAEREISRANRDKPPICVVMIDLDYFKLINDAFGHAAGDLTLQAFAELCRSLVRDQDHLARLGGEEFALLLPGCARDEALIVCERLRVSVENMRVDGAPASLRVTVSVGISEVALDENNILPALARADLALYGAKMRGRNKVVDANHEDLADCGEVPQPRALLVAV